MSTQLARPAKACTIHIGSSGRLSDGVGILGVETETVGECIIPSSRMVAVDIAVSWIFEG